MARTKGSHNRVLTTNIYIQVTPDYWKKIRQRAKEKGCHMDHYVRHLIDMGMIVEGILKEEDIK